MDAASPAGQARPDSPGGVTLLIPTLNEEIGMRAVMPRVDPSWCDQILVVDGQSTDGSVAYARDRGYDVLVQRRRGIRHAYIEAMPLVRGEYTITFSPDGNCIPEVIPEIVSRLKEGSDMVIASRYFDGLRSEDDDAVTRFGNWLFTTSINLLHGGHYSDAMGIFRGWRTPLFWELDLHREDGYAPERLLRTVIGVEPLLSMRAAKRRLRIQEVAGPEPPRIAGERKLQVIGWGGSYMLQNLRETVYWREDRARRAVVMAESERNAGRANATRAPKDNRSGVAVEV
jgi:glycosyltransferase involved in cell wall biosynthesis